MDTAVRGHGQVAAILELKDPSLLLLQEDVGRCYESLARSVADSVGAPACHLALYDSETDELIASRPSYADRAQPVPQYRFPLDSSPASALVVRTGEPFFSNSPETHALYDPSIGAHGVTSILTMPLRSAGRIVGLLYAINKPGGFDERDVTTVAALAGAAGVTLENISLYSGERERRLLNESLRELSRALVDMQSEDEALGTVLDQMWRVVRYQGAAALALDGTFLRVAASRGASPAHDARLPLDGPLGAMMDSRSVARISDVATRLPGVGLPASAGAALVAPLVAKGRPLGALLVAFGAGHVSTLPEGELVSVFADHAALFLQAGAVLRRERQARSRTAAVARISRMAATRKAPEAILAAAAPELISVSGADRAVLYLRHPRNPVLIPVADAGLAEREAANVRELRFDFGAGPLHRLVERRPVVFDDTSDAPPRFTAIANVTSLLALPLCARDELVGAVMLAWVDRPAGPDQATVEFLHDVTQQLELGIENASLLARFAQMAATDELTQLANRRRFSEFFQMELSRARRSGSGVGLVMLDLDHLKRINDTHGHQAGDAAIRNVADVLRQTVRLTDCAARLGGEEFGVVLSGTDLAGAAAKAERMRQELEAAVMPVVGTVTASIGVAVFPRDGDSEEQLVRVADGRMYAAKTAGRNRVRSTDDSPLRLESAGAPAPLD